MADDYVAKIPSQYSSREINFIVPCILNTTKFVLSHTNEEWQDIVSSDSAIYLLILHCIILVYAGLVYSVHQSDTGSGTVSVHIWKTLS